MTYNRKPIPKSVLILGAAGRIGGPLATFLAREAPSIRLRLVTSKEAQIEPLRQKHPTAEVVLANYLDVDSLRAAAQGMEGVFSITSSGMAETEPMTNLVTALKDAGTVVHALRVLGLQPEANVRRIPQSLVDQGLGLPVQHPIAKRILDESGLPFTYLNCGATFMDGLLGLRGGITRERKLVWPERLIPYIHPTDVAEVAGRLLLSDNHRHIGQFHTLNNGHDVLRFSDVAALMSELWGQPIGYDGSKEAFFKEYAMMGERRLQYLWDFFQYEQDNEVVWARNDFVERTLGRKPVIVRDFLIQHRDTLLGQG